VDMVEGAWTKGNLTGGYVRSSGTFLCMSTTGNYQRSKRKESMAIKKKNGGSEAALRR